MTPKAILGIIIRFCGLILILYSAFTCMYAVMRALEIFGLTDSVKGHFSKIDVTFCIIYLLSGIIIVRKADKIENFCYKTTSLPADK